MSVHSYARDTATDAVHLLSVLDERLEAMHEAMRGQPGAQRFGDVRGTGKTVTWCWEHQQEVADCLDADMPCTGETIAVGDPTGEAALLFDRAAADLARLSKDLKSARRLIASALRTADRWQPALPVNDRAGIGPCEACSKYCDGTKDRLRPVGEHRFCNACRMRESRFKPASA